MIATTATAVCVRSQQRAHRGGAGPGPHPGLGGSASVGTVIESRTGPTTALSPGAFLQNPAAVTDDRAWTSAVFGCARVI